MRFSIFLVFIMVTSSIQAQNTFKDAYDEFRKQAKTEYEDFRKKANQKYADRMRQAWE